MINESKQKVTSYEVVFVVSAVESWFCDQDERVQALFVQILDYFEEFGGGSNSNIPRSKIKKVRGSIWEIRVEQNTNIYRLLYSWEGKTCLLLHGFQKKSNEIPKNQIFTANKRLKKYKEEKAPMEKQSAKSKQPIGSNQRKNK